MPNSFQPRLSNNEVVKRLETIKNNVVDKIRKRLDTVDNNTPKKIYSIPATIHISQGTLIAQQTVSGLRFTGGADDLSDLVVSCSISDNSNGSFIPYYKLETHGKTFDVTVYCYNLNTSQSDFDAGVYVNIYMRYKVGE